MANPIEETVKALAVVLRTCSGIGQVLEEFPAANLKLTMPSITISSGEPEYTPEQPYVFEKSDPDVANKGTVKRVVGNYELKLQLDLWAKNKLERANFLTEIFRVMNPNPEVPGLNIALSAYYNTKANFVITGQKFDDTEASAQRQEWRASISVVAQCKMVLVRDEYLMITIENTLTTPDNIEV